MKKDRDRLTDASRSQQREKRRKTNLVLNSLIVLVLLLIVIVSVNIFGKNDKTEVDKHTNQTVAGTIKEKENSEVDGKSEQKKNEKPSDEEDEGHDSEEMDASNDENQDESMDTEALEDEQVVTDGGSDPNVSKTIKNPAWEPVESSQIEPAQDYKKGSVDWNEQLQAVSFATGFDQSKDTLLKLENNGPRKSAATVLIKETNTKYRVYIEWVEGEGWKPALVEEMAN